jgi:HK97 family phage major capsid protein
MNIEALRREYKEIMQFNDDLDKTADDEKRELSSPEFNERKENIARLQSIQKQLEQNDQVEKARQWAEKPIGEAEKDGGIERGGLYTPADPQKFSSLGSFMLSALEASRPNGITDKRLIRATGMSEGVPADGGFLVQQDFATNLLDFAFKTGKLASLCDNITISNNSNSVKVPGVNEASRADGSRQGGVRAYWKDEGATKTASAPTYRQVQLTLNKLIALTYSTDELLVDAAALESWIMSAFPREFGFKVDEAIINGTGAGQPLGIMNSPALVSVAIEAGQAAATIVAENIEKMYSRMLPDSLANARFFISQDCWPQIFQLHHAIGTGGVPVFMPPGNGLVDAPNGALFGRPIVPIEQCQPLGTAGDIIFADMSYYYWASKGGIKSDLSTSVKFVEDETAFRWVARYDGQPKVAAPIIPYNGSGVTISPFVALAARP